MVCGDTGFVIGSTEAIAVPRAAQGSSVVYLSGGIDVIVASYRR
jgi:hypothetical protein